MSAAVTRVTGHTAGPDRERWRMRGVCTEVRALARDIHVAAGTWDAVHWCELRIERAGEIYLTERYPSEIALQHRSAALQDRLREKGWTAVALDQPESTS